jgi:Zn-dependent protease with chaperone function
MAKPVPAHLGATSGRVAGQAVSRAVPSPAKSDPSRAAAGETILKAMDFTVPECEVPTGYGVALAGLVAFLIVFGAAYLALVGFLGWLLVWHVFQAAASLRSGPYLLFHLPMALLGGLLLLFLIKPVFSRRKSDSDAIVVLTPEDEPLLFAFLDKLCEATGARRPALVEVDCEPNAGARLFRTTVGGALGKDLVLRFGLPLAAGLSIRQFAGILAHELGHFRQRGGMKGSLLIRLMVAFFAKVVFERDRLDERLARMGGSASAFKRMVAWAAGWLIELARGVLWLMMVSGELLCCGVLRRMEYDADRIEAHVAGTREFLATSRLLVFLSIAARRARYDLGDAWEQRRLADDLPRLIVAHARQLAEYRDDILKTLDDQQTSWFDTHPSHADRVRNVQETGATGLLTCDVSAKHLFGDFGALCRRASETLYRSIVGEALDKGRLIPTAELVEQRKGERASFKALRRFFREGLAPSRPILPTDEALEPVAAGREAKVVKDLNAARDEMLAMAEWAPASAEQFERSSAALVANRVRTSMASILPFKGASRMAREAVRDRKTHEPLRLRSMHELIPFEVAARKRLTAGLRLAQSAAYRPKGAAADATTNSGEGLRSIPQLIAVCRALHPLVEGVEKLRELCIGMGMFFTAYDDEQPYPPLVRKILDLSGEARLLLSRLRGSLADRPFPFAHAKQGLSLGAALVEEIPKADDPAAVHAVGTSAVDRFFDVTYRALAELAEHAERVERALGHETLPEPTPREDKAAAEEERQEARRNSRRYWAGYGSRAAGGIAMMCVLVWLSISPPALPSMGWPDMPEGSGRSVQPHRPARFRLVPRPYRIGRGYQNNAPLDWR